MTLQELQTEYDNYIVYAKQFAKLNAEYNQKAIIAQQEYDNNCSNIAQSVKEFEDSIVMQRETARKEQEADLLNQKRLIGDMLKKTTSPDTKNSLLKMLDAVQLAHDITMKKIDEIDLENKNDLASKPEQLKQVIEADFQSKKESIVSEFEKIYNDYIYLQNKLFASRYETASSSNIFFWDKMPESDHMPITYTTYAISKLNCSLFGKVYSSEIYHIAPFINRNNIIITCDSTSKQLAQQLANAIVFRSACELSKNIKLNLVDTEGQTFNLGELRRLAPKIYDKFITDKREVSETIAALNNHITNITQKISRELPTLHDFNKSANVKQNNQLLYFTDFVFDVDERDMFTIDTIVRNGPRAGVNSIFVINKDQVELKNDREDRYKKNIDSIKRYSFELDITNFSLPQEYGLDLDNVVWETEGRLRVDKIVERINAKVKSGENLIIPFSREQLDTDLWWKKDSTYGIEVPMGVKIDENNSKFNLTYGIDENNYSSILVGLPGQGKSSFFHSLINNIMINYGPDEAQFYLIDLMGVEFEPYANPNLFLPHIKVISSETDREFAVNVIKELRNEIDRRVLKYQSVGTNNYSDYCNIVGRDKKDPHLFLVVDEFVRIFEENDKVSESIKADLIFMMDMGRKFGVHIVFACQSLKSSAVSFKPIIEKMPMRVVFNCLEDDAYELLGSNRNDINKIKRRGQMIFNNQKGRNINANDLVQVLFIDNTYRDNLLKEISNNAEKHFDIDKYNKLVYDVAKDAAFESNKSITEISSILGTKEVEVFLGQAINIASEDIYFNFKIDINSNLSVVGGDIDVSNRIITNAALSCMFNFKKEKAEYHIFNGMNSEDDNYDIPKKYLGDVDKKVFFYEREIIGELEKFKARLDNRMTGEEAISDRIFLIFYSFQQFNEFRIEAYQRNSLSILDYLLSRGSEYGIHLIMQFRDWNSFTTTLGNSNKKVFFAHKVALQMSMSDALIYIGYSEPSKLYSPAKPYSKSLGYYNLDGNPNITKFKTYAYPNISWIRTKMSTI